MSDMGANSSTTGEAYFKNFRVYEISEEECNSLMDMSADDIAKKYPYVDVMIHNHFHRQQHIH